MNLTSEQLERMAMDYTERAGSMFDDSPQDVSAMRGISYAIIALLQFLRESDEKCKCQSSGTFSVKVGKDLPDTIP